MRKDNQSLFPCRKAETDGGEGAQTPGAAKGQNAGYVTVLPLGSLNPQGF